MKKILLIFSFLSFLSIYTYAQNSQDTKTDSIKFKNLVHDYGKMKQGSDGNCEFIFTNNGKAPIIISNVKAACGCTTPDWTKVPVNPGEKGFVKVGYNTQIPGTFIKTITVNSSAINSMVVLTIKGEVIPNATN